MCVHISHFTGQHTHTVRAVPILMMHILTSSLAQSWAHGRSSLHFFLLNKITNFRIFQKDQLTHQIIESVGGKAHSRGFKLLQVILEDTLQ